MVTSRCVMSGKKMNEAEGMIVEEKYNIEADLIYTDFKSTSILLKIIFHSHLIPRNRFFYHNKHIYRIISEL